jgi:UDP-N-acetylglucosamine 3-dehydrogenase
VSDLRVGIVGAGRVAERHAAAYASHPAATVVAVAEPMRERGEQFAAAFGARWFPSADELLAAGLVEAVSVCVPHDAHLPVARAAARHRVHVLLEKPIANTMEEADAIVSAAESAGVVLMIGFVHRFRSEVLEAKRLIEAGAVGTPATALDRFCSLGGPHPPGWVWQRERAGGGVLMYGGIHAVDRLRWLLGQEVVSVAARSHRYGGFGDVEDGLVALLDYSDGTTGALFENSPPYGRPGGWATEIFGSEGAIRIQTGEWVELTSSTGSTRSAATDELHFEREIDEFVTAIAEARPPSVSAEDGRASLLVALAVYAAAESRARVAVPPR